MEEEPNRRHVTLNVFGVSGRRVTLGAMVGGRVLTGGLDGDGGNEDSVLVLVVAVGVDGEEDWIKIAGLKMSLSDGSDADLRT